VTPTARTTNVTAPHGPKQHKPREALQRHPLLLSHYSSHPRVIAVLFYSLLRTEQEGELSPGEEDRETESARVTRRSQRARYGESAQKTVKALIRESGTILQSFIYCAVIRQTNRRVLANGTLARLPAGGSRGGTMSGNGDVIKQSLEILTRIAEDDSVPRNIRRAADDARNKLRNQESQKR